MKGIALAILTAGFDVSSALYAPHTMSASRMVVTAVMSIGLWIVTLAVVFKGK